ncbi:MAG: cupin domain-containing protein [Candidatus Andersenbacteria bacterium]
MNKIVFKQSDAKAYELPGGYCYLYPDSSTGRLSCALVEQDGRYPTEGYKQNDVCTEALFILDGNFEVTVNGKTHQTSKHDVTYIPPKTPYAVEGKGTVFVFIEPKWDSGQNTPVG